MAVSEVLVLVPVPVWVLVVCSQTSFPLQRSEFG